MKFTKMQGTGNDFIVIDQREKQFGLSKSLIKRLSDRHFGIGFDQLLI
ncbi:MAG: diaminopimelate epimerase, partial [Nitrosomonadales bacterium]|nr:diaminopimelate epimerase [Nitrosomonadales bacterium]